MFCAEVSHHAPENAIGRKICHRSKPIGLAEFHVLLKALLGPDRIVGEKDQKPSDMLQSSVRQRASS